jgi:predicted RNA-binding protein with RPS1 domain
VLPGIEGLVHNSQADLRGHKDLRALLAPGEKVSVRVLSVDGERERLGLSLLHPDGQPIAADEAPAHESYLARADERAASDPAFGQRLREAFEQARREGSGDGGSRRPAPR